jgi:dTDP-4-amino-4,6-dideoxygalactose transaminase
MPKLSDVQEYYQLAEKHGQYSNFGLCNDVAVTKLQKVYPGSYPVLVNNGTTAIQIALLATLPRGSRVALPTFTFTATLNAVVAAGMNPVLFDVDPITWCIDLDLLKDNKDKYDAIIVVSPFGYAVDIISYDTFGTIANKPIVYDFAPAWGHPISPFYPTTFSFHATKTLPIGEGGAIMFTNPASQAYGKRLINFDFNNQMPESLYGMNGKMDELHAATLCVQLDRNEELLKATSLSNSLVHNLTYNNRLIKSPDTRKNNYLQLPVVRIELDRLQSVIDKLNEHKIANKRYYKPFLHEEFPALEFVSGSSLQTPVGTLGLPRPSDVDEGNRISYIILNAVRS